MRFRRFIILTSILLCALSVQAQSGRRRTPPPPAAPVPTPTPEPTPVPKKAEKEPDLFFFLGATRHSSNSNLPFSYYDAVLRGCADRLRSGSSAAADVTDKDFNRGEAIKKAKSETKAYVVHLVLSLDWQARSYDDLILEYVVFAPATAKVLTTGRTYLTGQRAGPVVVGPNTRGSTGGLFREELLKRMGEDAGDRILKSLHLDVSAPNK